MFMDKEQLFISRGADEIFYMDEISPDNAKLLLQAYEEHKDEFTAPAGLERDIDLLIKAGVLCEHFLAPAAKKTLSVGIRWIGNEDKGLTDLIGRLTANRLMFVPCAQSQFMLIIRTSQDLSEIMNEYTQIDKPHILIDLGYDHTVSIGPLVFPKKTACLGCLTGRVTSAWGILPAPKRPNVLENCAFIAGLTAEILIAIAKTGTYPELVNQTVSFNLSTFKTQTDAVFTLPWCPYCYPDGYPHKGRLEWRDSVC